MDDNVRYELNHDGEIVIGQAALCPKQNNMLIELFAQFGNDCSITKKEKTLTVLKLKNQQTGERTINVFHGRIRDESRNPYEKKIQLGKDVDPREYDQNNTLILGIYVYQADDSLEHAIFVGFPIADGINYPTNPSLRGGLFVNKLLQKAKLSGFYVDKAHGLVGFRPEFIFYYLENHLELHYGKVVDEHDFQQADNNEDPHNWIYFGAPGTGKSFRLNKRALGDEGEKGAFSKDNARRVTFHPDYTYAQFVGNFKPYSDPDKDSQITYRYVFGPFMDTYLEAISHPYERYVLIIEELNRANPAAVFGDIFQLLDRNLNGNSEYAITPPDEMSAEISCYLSKLSTEEKEAIEAYYDPDMSFEDFRNQSVEALSLPNNMYIWATMNSADQGVYPMDTAFKRRWEFNYIGIDEGESIVENEDMPIGTTGNTANWNSLRKAINRKLLEAKVNEDKLMGPFFIAPPLLSNKERLNDVFKNKVLLYLFEDAAKTKRGLLFKDGTATYSQLCAEYDKNGVEGIFNAMEIEYINSTDVEDNLEDAVFSDDE